MEWRQYSLSERVFIVEHYFRSYAVNNDGFPCLGHVRDLFSTRFSRPPPPLSHIVRLVDTFRQTGSVLSSAGYLQRPRSQFCTIFSQ
ncbi:hypothetical protein J6590_056742 [Homalodisca vitripennis]|nr:hypothetical protein J6590_056742 [Homalodisca vitripennis]